jgi:hypothetical protein
MKLISSNLSLQVSEIFDHSWNYRECEVKKQIQNIVSEINFFHCSPRLTLMGDPESSIFTPIFCFSSIPYFKQPFNLSVVFTEPNLNF